MSKKNIRFGSCQNPECMNIGMSMEIPEDGKCPICHQTMKPEEADIDSEGFDLGGLSDNTSIEISDSLSNTGVGDKKKNKWIVPAIITVTIVVLGCAATIWKYGDVIKSFLQPTPKPVLVESLSVQDSVLNMKLNDKKLVLLTVTPESNDETIKWSSSDTLIATVSSIGEIIAKKPGKATILATTNLSNKNARIEVTVKDPRVINLGYGVYTGDVRNGKPHGHGIIRYTSNHQIVSWKDFVASPGDTFEGDFRDGKITGLGYWKRKSDGNIIAIQ